MNLYDYYLLSIFYQILYYVKVQKILHNSSWKYARKCECIDTLFQTLYSYQYNVLRTAMWNRLTLPLWKPISQRSPLLQTQIQAVPVWSSLYHSLIYFSSFTFPGAPCRIFLRLFPGFLPFSPSCHRTTTTNYKFVSKIKQKFSIFNKQYVCDELFILHNLDTYSISFSIVE